MLLFIIQQAELWNSSAKVTDYKILSLSYKNQNRSVNKSETGFGKTFPTKEKTATQKTDQVFWSIQSSIFHTFISTYTL